MNKILISVVGHSDDKENGPIMTILKSREFDFNMVYLIATKDSNIRSGTQAKLPGLRQLIEDDFSNLSIKTDCIPSTISLKELQRCLKNSLKKIEEDYPPGKENEYTTNVSSGFSQLNTVLFLLKDSGLLNSKIIEIREATRERPVPEIFQTDYKFSVMDQYLKHAKEFLKCQDYKNLANELEKFQKDSPSGKKEIPELLKNICKAYDDWDHIRYQEAKNEITGNNILKKLKELNQKRIESISQKYNWQNNELTTLKEHLEIQSEVLNAICLYDKIYKSEPQGSFLQRLIDIYYLLQRLFSKGEYINILSIFHTVYKLLIEEFQDKKEELDKNIIDNIDEIDDTSDLENLRDLLIINHGDFTITKELAEKLIDVYKENLKIAFNLDDKQIEEYPFNMDITEFMTTYLNAL